MTKKALCLIVILVTFRSFAAIRPNPLISRSKPIYASFSGSPAGLVDGKYGETAWSVKDSSWAALKLESGPTSVLFIWNATNLMWSDRIGNPDTCARKQAVPVNYAILVSGNSTNGNDGSWTTACSVAGNTVSNRGHTIDFSGSC